ncbi:MAG TPA: hypothetical protein VF735_16875 [Pyrinomonadaceae bacterium]
MKSLSEHVLRLLALLAILIAACTVAPACEPCLAEKSLNWEQSIREASLIVVGSRVGAVMQAPEGEQPQQIKVQVGRVLRGSVRENQITVHSWSGMCPYGVVLNDNDQYVLLLRDGGEFYNAVAMCSVKAMRIAGGKEESVVLDPYAKEELPLAQLLRDYIAPPEYKRVIEFLQYLKGSGSPDVQGAFDENLGGHWRVDELLSYISKNVLTVFNINDKRTQRYSMAELRRLLSSKNNKASKSFIHLGYIYAQPYPQYSTLKYEPRANGVVLNMSGWYRLTFKREDGALKLTKLEYLQVEGD